MYSRSIQAAVKSTFVEQRIENIVEQINYIIYSNVCRGLYEKDKIIFSLLLAITILRKDKKLNEKQIMFFVSPFDIVKFKDEKTKVDWIPDVLWRKIKSSESLDGRFAALSERIVANNDAWETFFTSVKPDEVGLPEPFEEANDLERLLLFKIFRPEAVARSIRKYV